MSGFSLYETLRIFVPGALGVLIADLTVRLATGPDVFAPAAGVATDVVETLESTGPFAGLALFLGLLLYLVDLPSRMRWVEGLPDGPFRRPTAVLAEMLKDTSLEGDEISLYFLLSDRYLPDELHKRVYLFGSLYRIFVDLRVLAATALVGGSVLAVITARADGELGDVMVGWQAVAAVVVVLALVAAVAAFGIRAHALRRAKSDGPPSARGSSLVGPTLVILALGAMAVAVAVLTEPPLAYAALVPAAGALAMWWAVEVGPSGPGSQEWRAMLLRRLGAEPSDEPQFSVAQRLLTELALVATPLAAAAIAASLQGRSDASVMAWALLAVPATAVMSIRKHETRLLSAYSVQGLWLRLSKKKILEIDRSRELPDEWK